MKTSFASLERILGKVLLTGGGLSVPIGRNLGSYHTGSLDSTERIEDTRKNDYLMLRICLTPTVGDSCCILIFIRLYSKYLSEDGATIISMTVYIGLGNSFKYTRSITYGRVFRFT